MISIIIHAKLDSTLMNGLLWNVNHYVLVIGCTMKLLVNALVFTCVLIMSIMIQNLMLVLAGLLLNAQETNTLTVLIVNVKFLVLYGLKNNNGVIVLKIIST